MSNRSTRSHSRGRLEVPSNVNTHRGSRSRSRTRTTNVSTVQSTSQEASSVPSRSSKIPTASKPTKKPTLTVPPNDDPNATGSSPNPNASDTIDPKSSRRKPRGSICDEPAPKQDSFFNFIDEIEKGIEEHDFGDYEEIEGMRALFQTARKRKETVEKYRAEHTEANIKVMSFSRATEADLVRIGVSGYHRVDKSELLAKVSSQLSAAALEAIAKSAIQSSVVLPQLRNFISTLNEAGARQVIDKVLFESWSVCQVLGISLFGRLELPIPPLALPVEKGIYATFISGQLDYNLSSKNFRFNGFELRSMQEQKQTIHVFGDYADKRLTSTVLEAKADEDESGNGVTVKTPTLGEHVPQVLYECMGMPRRVTATPSEKASFILANSRRWIFGVIDRKMGEVYMSDDIIMENDIGDILRLLVYWETIGSDEIYDMMKPLQHRFDVMPSVE